jgi:myosin heavy subunit
VLDLLEKYPTGLFDLLDEGCKIKLDDEKLLTKIRSNPSKSPLFIAPKMLSRPTFTVVHTAKDVEYTIAGFGEKNKDEPSVLLLRTSA